MSFIHSPSHSSEPESNISALLTVDPYPSPLSRKQATGNVLSLHDAEMQLINSGSAGMRRLAAARGFDIQEIVPGMSDRDAKMIGAAYVMLRLQAMSGALTTTTRAEVTRLNAVRHVLDDDS
jgi:hypothetical protein